MTEPTHYMPKVVTPQIEAEARHLMKVAIRAAWAYEHGLRIGRDDASELSVYAQRLAMLLGWLPLNCNAAQSRKFQEEVSGLTFDSICQCRISEGRVYRHHIPRCPNAEAAEPNPAKEQTCANCGREVYKCRCSQKCPVWLHVNSSSEFCEPGDKRAEVEQAR